MKKGGFFLTGIAALLGAGCAEEAETPEEVRSVEQAVHVSSGVTERQPRLKWGGRTQAISSDPGNNNFAIAATDNGGAFRTTNGGSSWTHLDGLRPTELLDVAICPDDPDIVLVTAVQDTGSTLADNGGGIWRSDDGGLTWGRPAGHAPVDGVNNPMIYSAFEISFAADNSDCENVYVGTNQGLAVSTDAGASFSHVQIDGSNTTVVSVVAGSGGLVDIHAADGHHRSTASGANFSATNPGQGPFVGGNAPTGLPNPTFTVQSFATHSLSISPFNTQVLYGAARQVQTVVDGSGNSSVQTTGGFEIYESIDGGANWTPMNMPPQASANRVPFIFAVARNGSSTDYELFASDGVDMYRRDCVEPPSGSTGSPCAGTSWVFIDLDSQNGTYESVGGTPQIVDCSLGTTPCTHNDPSDLTFNPADGCPLYMASDSGVQTPLAPGSARVPAGVECGSTGTWLTVGTQNGFDALEIYDIAGVGVAGGPFLYIGLQDNDLWASPDGGATWPNNRRAEGLGLSVATDGTSANTVVTGFACAACENFRGNFDFSTLDPWDDPDNINATCADNFQNNRPANLTPDGICDPIRGREEYSILPMFAGAAASGSPAIHVQWDSGGTDANRDPIQRYQMHLTTNFGMNWTAVAGATVPPPGFPIADPRDAATPIDVYNRLQGPPIIAGSDSAGNLTVYQSVFTPCVDTDGDTSTCEQTNRVQLFAFQLTNTASSGTPTATFALASQNFGDIPFHSIQFKDDEMAYAVDPNNPQRIIAADARNVPANGRPGLRQSTDGGQTWSGTASADLAMDELTRLVSANGRYDYEWNDFEGRDYAQISSMKFNPANSNMILVGTEQVGIISSLDGGSSWAHVCGSERIPRVTSFFFDNNAGEVYASSYGRGVWIVDPAEQQRPEFSTVPPANPTSNTCGPVDVGVAVAEDHCENQTLSDIVITSDDDPLSAASCSLVVGSNTVCGDFGRGDTSLTWTATDDFGNQTSVSTTVTVDDTTPPVLTLPENRSVTLCNYEGVVEVGQATAVDDCIGPVTPTGQVISTNGVLLTTPIDVVGGEVTLGPGTHVIRWTATDGITPASDDQIVTVGTGIQADDAFYLENGAALLDEDGDPISLLNSGTGQSSVGVGSFADDILAAGNASVAPGGNVFGDITVGGTASVDPAANYGGTTTEGATITLPELPGLPPFDPPIGDDDWVGPGEVLTLDPGSYPIIGINSNPNNRATLELLDGDYFFTELHINADAILVTSPGTRIFVSGYFGVHDRVTFEGAPLYIGLGGNQNSTIESPFTGTLIAPDRHIELGIGSEATFTGSVHARSIRVRPNTILVCVPTDAAVTPDPGCNDSDMNGDETDIDCGGPVCPGCGVGQDCEDGDDCLEGVCDGAVCAAPACDDGVQNGGELGEDCGGPCLTSCEPAVTISAEVVSPALHDWGWGYCVEVRVVNEGSGPASGWSVTIDTGNSTIYDDWNGVFSGNSGTVTVTPEFDWNQTLEPGEVSTAIGFCANRWTPFSGVLPSVVGVSP